MFRSRRGTSYIVEASLIYPVIVAVTVMLLAGAVYFYGLTAAASDQNRAVRREAGERSDTVYYNEADERKKNRMPVAESGGIFGKKVTVTSASAFQNRILFNIAYKGEYTAEAHVISEADTLWNRQVIKNALGSILE